MNTILRHRLFHRLLLLFLAFEICMWSKNSLEAGDDALRPVQDTKQTYVYECGEGYDFPVSIEGEKAWLFLPDQTVCLLRVSSDTGAKFSNGTISYWIKGNEAFFELENETYRGCKSNRAKALWEDAKLRGVDFRAVGNEPGWHIEITKDDKVLFVNNYGENRYEFATPPPLADQPSRVTRYEIKEDGHEMIIVLKGEPCLDTMSGESFDVTVTVTFDGRVFSGCGRVLH